MISKIPDLKKTPPEFDKIISGQEANQNLSKILCANLRRICYVMRKAFAYVQKVTCNIDLL